MIHLIDKDNDYLYDCEDVDNVDFEDEGDIVDDDDESDIVDDEIDEFRYDCEDDDGIVDAANDVYSDDGDKFDEFWSEFEAEIAEILDSDWNDTKCDGCDDIPEFDHMVAQCDSCKRVLCEPCLVDAMRVSLPFTEEEIRCVVDGLPTGVSTFFRKMDGMSLCPECYTRSAQEKIDENKP
jgi:hypothetical protein